MHKFLLIGAVIICSAAGVPQRTTYGPCYNSVGAPRPCYPDFEDVAFNRPIEVTNTCGQNGPTEFCELNSASRSSGIPTDLEKCPNVCSEQEASLSHPAKYLTDLKNNDNPTWWQSETLHELKNQQINLTLSLNKTIDVTYIRLIFHSPRPASFAIYKRTVTNGPWIPFQYYSHNCSGVYGLPDSNSVTDPKNEAQALCTSDFSDISPLTGGSVAFSTLGGRPSAYNFQKNSNLREWVTATDIRISLDEMNTFGDEVFGKPSVLKSYYYGISQFQVGGKCICNGHAAECLKTVDDGGKLRRSCKCEHNTAGDDCVCLPFYNDQPWSRATEFKAKECKACDCKGFSEECYFDQELYEKTGHGGHCINCNGNRTGPNCEFCKENYFQAADGTCLPCGCNEIGSKSLQCNAKGECECKAGVSGRACDFCRSSPDFFNFSKTLNCFRLQYNQMKFQA